MRRLLYADLDYPVALTIYVLFALFLFVRIEAALVGMILVAALDSVRRLLSAFALF